MVNKKIALSRGRIKHIIKEAIRAYMLEYHHSGNENLYNDAINIGNKIIEYYKTGWDGSVPIKYNSLSFGDEGGITIYVYLTDSDVSQFEVWSIIKISKGLVIDAIDNGNSQRLLSAIYHELGHMVNVRRSKSLFQARKDINMPLMFKLSDDEYASLGKVLYRFNLREMRARCYETEMFLRQGDKDSITIEDIYNNRCSDITLMRNFVNYLLSKCNGNLSEKDGYIIKKLYNSVFHKRIFNKSGLNLNEKAKKLYKFFNARLIWFKARIDKIYSDYKMEG